MRTNVDGRRVPVVLGWAVTVGALGALTSVVLVVISSDTPRSCAGLALCSSSLRLWAAAGVPLAGMFAAGFWDDLRGDERPRGFAGHLGALGGGAVTGGMVKLVSGAVVGLVTAAVVVGGIEPLPFFVATALSVALSANLVNLLDRAPGRALKVFLLLALPLAVAGGGEWRMLAAGGIGAALAALPLDLRAAAMLGDAGANPLGAIVGLGLAVSLRHSDAGLVGLVIVLLAVNLASERWSFSEIIATSRWLARLDHLGRK
jgi:hypothetical protein